jgi:hypothetical protein
MRKIIGIVLLVILLFVGCDLGTGSDDEYLSKNDSRLVNKAITLNGITYKFAIDKVSIEGEDYSYSAQKDKLYIPVLYIAYQYSIKDNAITLTTENGDKTLDLETPPDNIPIFPLWNVWEYQDENYFSEKFIITPGSITYQSSTIYREGVIRNSLSIDENSGIIIYKLTNTSPRTLLPETNSFFGIYYMFIDNLTAKITLATDFEKGEFVIVDALDKAESLFTESNCSKYVDWNNVNLLTKRNNSNQVVLLQLLNQ